MKTLIIASSALMLVSLSACMPETKPASGRMTTDEDKRLNVVSESPSTAKDLSGIRAGSTIPPATDRPLDYEPQTHSPTDTGARDRPSDQPYLGNPTTRPVH